MRIKGPEELVKYLQNSRLPLSLLAVIVAKPDQQAPEHELVNMTLEAAFGNQYNEFCRLIAPVATNFFAQKELETTSNGFYSPLVERLNDIAKSPYFAYMANGINECSQLLAADLDARFRMDIDIWQNICNLPSAFNTQP